MTIYSDITDDYDPHRDHDLVIVQVEVHRYRVELSYEPDTIRATWTDAGTRDADDIGFDILDVADHGRVYCEDCDLWLDGVSTPEYAT